MNSQPNPLVDCGKPLFFQVANSQAADITAPALRMGEAVRLYVRSLSLMQKEALAASAHSGAVWRLASDEGAYLAGLDAAPCPLAFFSTGMVCSFMNEILALAKIRGLAVNNIRLVQDNYYTMRGSARDGSMTGGARNVDLSVQMDSDADRDSLYQLAMEGVAAASVNGLLRGSKSSLFSLTHNGRRIETGRALPPGGPTLPDLGDRFTPAQPADADFSGLVRRNGPSPRLEHTVTLANDSLAERQDRLLHLRVICAVREDGAKEVTQYLYNPHGTSFHFLCDEAPIAGGGGLAPDAASYLSAGIGFCFMTQFGRYAKIMHRDLREYQIVQDTHFSPGGASGGTGQAGTAAPVETHVYLETGEDDDFARNILAMAEQTCFLHALCKTDLKIRVKVEPLSR